MVNRVESVVPMEVNYPSLSFSGALLPNGNSLWAIAIRTSFLIQDTEMMLQSYERLCHYSPKIQKSNTAISRLWRLLFSVCI